MMTSAATPADDTIGGALAAATARLTAAGVDSPRLDARVLLAHVLGAAPEAISVHARAPLDASARARFAAAVARREPATRRLWFDVASIVDADVSSGTAELVLRFIRQVGPDRVLYGSDAAVGPNLRPREAWAAFRQLPLTRAELTTIADNVAPYLQ